MAYTSQGMVISQKAPPANFLERTIELQGISGVDMKTVGSNTVFTSVSDQGLFVPIELILVATTITALGAQAIVTFRGSDYVTTMTAANDYDVFHIGVGQVIVGIATAIAASSAVAFTVKAAATGTTYTVRAFIRGFYLG